MTVYAYTVHDAIRDGSKVNVDTLLAESDTPNMRKEAGYVWPVVLSDRLLDVINGEYNGARGEPQEEGAVEKLEGEGQSITGRLWDVLFVGMQMAVKKMVATNDHFGSFEVSFRMRVKKGEKFATESRDVKIFVSVDYWNEEHGCWSFYLPEEY